MPKETWSTVRYLLGRPGRGHCASLLTQPSIWIHWICKAKANSKTTSIQRIDAPDLQEHLLHIVPSYSTGTQQNIHSRWQCPWLQSGWSHKPQNLVRSMTIIGRSYSYSAGHPKTKHISIPPAFQHPFWIWSLAQAASALLERDFSGLHPDWLLPETNQLLHLFTSSYHQLQTDTPQMKNLFVHTNI